MCLSNCVFNLQYDEKVKDFVGVGYKAVNKSVFESRYILWSYDESGYGKIKRKKLRPLYSMNRWYTAKGKYVVNASGWAAKPTYVEWEHFANQGGTYWPGFHLFLNLADAVGYFGTTYCDVMMLKCQFRGVTCFGENLVNMTQTPGPKKKPCIIAQHMKIVEIVGSEADLIKSATPEYRYLH